MLGLRVITLTSSTASATASYIYNHTISLTGGYFNTWGTSDVLLFTGAGFTTGSPNSDGWTFDLAYLPFSYGGPRIWPWLNARIGITYTHYNRFDGSVNNVDQTPEGPLRTTTRPSSTLGSFFRISRDDDGTKSSVLRS